MVITYLGKSLVKIQVGELVLALNPHAGAGSKKAPKFGADIVVSSSSEKDFSQVENMTYGNKVPFVVSGPGEYEIGGVYIKGILTEKDKLNTTYVVILDALRICTLGAQKKAALDPSVKEFLGEIDILIVPIGGGDVLNGEGAYKATTLLEPKIVIPVHYENGKNTKEGLKFFLKELGVEKADTLPKYVVKKKDVEGKESEVVVLEEQ